MKAIFNVEEALRFASLLEREAAEMRARDRAVSEALLALHAVWRDDKYDKLSHVYEEASLHLNRFLERADIYAVHLRKKSRIIQDLYYRQ